MTDLRLYTYGELADAWRVSVRTVQTWVYQDERLGRPVPRARRRVGKGRWVVLMTGATAAALLERHQPRLFVPGKVQRGAGSVNGGPVR